MSLFPAVRKCEICGAEELVPFHGRVPAGWVPPPVGKVMVSMAVQIYRRDASGRQTVMCKTVVSCEDCLALASTQSKWSQRLGAALLSSVLWRYNAISEGQSR
jgi:hypothetical protein